MCPTGVWENAPKRADREDKDFFPTATRRWSGEVFGSMSVHIPMVLKKQIHLKKRRKTGKYYIFKGYDVVRKRGHAVMYLYVSC